MKKNPNIFSGRLFTKMKKLGKIAIKEGEIKAKEDGNGRNSTTNNDTSCDCCSSNIIASATEEKDQGFDQEHQVKDKEQRLNNPKLLIVIGLALTIPIVLLELLS